MKNITYLLITLSLIILTGCGMSEDEKAERTKIITDNFQEVVQNVFSNHNLNKDNLCKWSVYGIKPSATVKGALELTFSFELNYDEKRDERFGIHRDYYEFNGTIYANANDNSILKDDSGRYLIDINTQFNGAYGPKEDKYYDPNMVFKEFSNSKSELPYGDKNKTVEFYYNTINRERNNFIRDFSQDEKIAIYNSFNSAGIKNVKIVGKWVEITYGDNVPYNEPSKVCEFLFDKHHDVLRYSTGVRLFSQNGKKLGAYRNPNDFYN